MMNANSILVYLPYCFESLPLINLERYINRAPDHHDDGGSADKGLLHVLLPGKKGATWGIWL